MSDTSPTPEPGTTPEEQVLADQAARAGEITIQPVDAEASTKQELEEKAAEAGVSVDPSMTKADIASAINQTATAGTGLNQPRERFPWETDPAAAVRS